MNDDFFLQEFRDANEVVVTPHALERGYDEDDVKDRVSNITGVLYMDTKERTYHLVDEELVILINVRNGKRIVVTAYPHDDPGRYHSIRYRLLRG